MRQRRETGALDGGGEFGLTIDRDWRITSITPEAARWGGSTPQLLVGADSRARWPLPMQLLEAIEGSFASGEPSRVEFASVLMPGRWVEFTVKPSCDGADIRFADITESRARQRLSPEEGPEAFGDPRESEVALLDERGVIVSVNAVWRATLAQHCPQIADAGLGAHYIDVCNQVVPDLDRTALSAEFDAMRAGAISQIRATFALPAAHGRRSRQVRITPLAIGGRRYFLAVYEDLTRWMQITAALRETSGQLLRAQEKERQRIAIELHDSMSQNLAAMALGLARLRRLVGQDPAATSVIDDLSTVTQQSVQETRVLSHLMNASSQAREGLETSVRRLVEGFGRRSGLDVSLEVHGRFDVVDAETHHAIFRLVQEALSNVHRHAHATTVSVSLESRAGRLIASIADDGQGFRSAGERQAPLGVGVMGMRARVGQLGGSFEIDGSAGGTVVTASVPISASDAKSIRRTKRPVLEGCALSMSGG